MALSTYLGHSKVSDTYWYLEATPELMKGIAETLRILRHRRAAMTPIAPHITAFLKQRLPVERAASDNTCASYAYAFKLLFEYASDRLKVPPSALCLEQLDAPLIVELSSSSGNRAGQWTEFQKHPARCHQVVHALFGISCADGVRADPAYSGDSGKESRYPPRPPSHR